MSASVHADPPPAVVCDPEGLQYATGQQLGKGGFAICHRAELMGHGNLSSNVVALKIVKSKMEPPKLAQKFVTELQIHSKLAHPNIVEFYRAFSFESSTFVVLEICENGSLADAIKKRKYFTMPEIRRFMIQTCGAIKYLHQRNIVHRDLKTGNLFLDKDMNVKIGDFGLAALLVSPNDLSGIRRTTMCGTPNYLAPEVLEKTGKGHNEKVDLWAIGIIMYTLAVGRAPFHAAKREEIYKKLQKTEYSWPELSKTGNDISDDLRDVVGSLLVHEDDRPIPDQIVSHPFFKLGYIPLQLDSICATRIPKWTRVRPPTAATLKRGYTDEWYTLCKASAVGEYEPGKTFGGYGARRNKTVAKDCQKEIQSNKQPTVPFSKDTVYLPFPERTTWPYQSSVGLSDIVEEKESSSEGPALLETSGNEVPQRRIQRMVEDVPPLKENIDPVQETDAVRRVVERPTRIRSIRKISNPERVTAATVSARATRPTRMLQRAKSAKEIAREEEPLAETPSLRVVKSNPTVLLETNVSRSEKDTVDIHGLISDMNKLRIGTTDPTTVLARLHIFKENVARALERKPTPSSKFKSGRLPFVSKWVDYSGKYGVGYVLEDGSIGSILTGTSQHPVTITVARNGFDCLKEVAKDPTYMARMPLEFYADTTGRGLSLLEIVDPDRRHHACSIWTKFGKYMCQQLGQQSQQDKQVHDKEEAPANFVSFYQRLGNVGVWGFIDGSFQFNFPDHTKLVFSPDGAYCKFTCLPKEAAQFLKDTGNVPFKYIKNRKILQGSLQQLLYGSAEGGDSFKELTEANLLRKKLDFVKSIISGWVLGGGLGCLEEPKYFKWDGPQLEDGKRQDWVTVGRYGGDKR